MDNNGIKVKTVEYTASSKNDFQCSVKHDILHYDTKHILVSILQPAAICNCFFRIKKHKLE